MTSHDMPFVRAVTAAHWREARSVIQQYAASLEFDLEFQDFEGEMEALPQHYGPPGGSFLLARERGATVGCVGLRRLADGVCEMKRLYVLPGQRGRGLGRRLAEAIIAEGRRLGYARMRLDTVPSMQAARALYRSLGFQTISAYRFNPISGTAFMELPL